ncbi:MAG: hypothetical protein K0R76_392 [Alphaproteobacteria bacterium]|jgi:hypothetical protein|nr:hypothetical protein [Alphaproteobacteria bacterium]
MKLLTCSLLKLFLLLLIQTKSLFVYAADATPEQQQQQQSHLKELKSQLGVLEAKKSYRKLMGEKEDPELEQSIKKIQEDIKELEKQPRSSSQDAKQPRFGSRGSQHPPQLQQQQQQPQSPRPGAIPDEHIEQFYNEELKGKYHYTYTDPLTEKQETESFGDRSFHDLTDHEKNHVRSFFHARNFYNKEVKGRDYTYTTNPFTEEKETVNFGNRSFRDLSSDEKRHVEFLFHTQNSPPPHLGDSGRSQHKQQLQQQQQQDVEEKDQELDSEEKKRRDQHEYSKYIHKKYEYIQEKLKSVDRYDPPYFRLTTHDNRKVYILGSLHDMHPQLLLPAAAWKKIVEFIRRNPDLIFITEHSGKEEQKYPNLNDQPVWDPEGELLGQVPVARIKEWSEMWERVKDMNLLNPHNLNLKVGDVARINKNEGIMLLYSFSYYERTRVGLQFANFEGVFYQMLGAPPKGFLEDKKRSVLLDSDISFFFRHSMNRIQEALRYYDVGKNEGKEKAWDQIVSQYILSLPHYRYDIDLDSAQESTNQRNKEWSDRLQKYLNEEAPQGKNVLIVCGVHHLKQIPVQNFKSFLEYLLAIPNKYFTSIDKMTKEGRWEPMKDEE